MLLKQITERSLQCQNALALHRQSEECWGGNNPMKTKVREGGGRNPPSPVEGRERASSWVSVGQPAEVNTPHKELNERSVFKP